MAGRNRGRATSTIDINTLVGLAGLFGAAPASAPAPKQSGEKPDFYGKTVISAKEVAMLLEAVETGDTTPVFTDDNHPDQRRSQWVVLSDEDTVTYGGRYRLMRETAEGRKRRTATTAPTAEKLQDEIAQLRAELAAVKGETPANA